MIKIIPENCPQDHKCPAVNACPVGALMQDGNSAPTIDQEKCINCGLCVSVCAMGAIIWE